MSIDLIKDAFKEDIPSGDVTTESLGVSSYPGFAHLIAKEDLVLSGKSLFREAIQYLEPSSQISWYFEDGDWILKGQEVALIEGNLIEVLKAERVALNFLGHLSGVATFTRCFAKAVGHTKCKILDTRKTTPLYRQAEKKAVADGHGTNHRFNLSEAILIKENHIRIAGGIPEAIRKVRQNSTLPIEIEVTNVHEVQLAVDQKVDRLLLDNMSNEVLKQALEIIPKGVITEASGNMTLDRVASVAELGVDYISVGALTHSAPCADLSLLFSWSEESR